MILVLSIITLKILKDSTIATKFWLEKVVDHMIVMLLSFPAYSFHKGSRTTNKHLANWLNSRQNNFGQNDLLPVDDVGRIVWVCSSPKNNQSDFYNCEKTPRALFAKKLNSCL